MKNTISQGLKPSELLQMLLAREEITANQLAEKLGGKGLQSAISRMYAGATPRPSTMQPIADHFGIDVSAFLTSRAATECAARLGLNEVTPDFAGALTTARTVPVTGAMKMGESGLCEEASLPEQGYVEFHSSDETAYGIKMRGASMFPAIRDGWFLVIEPQSTPSVGEYVLIKLRSGSTFVKELLFKRTDTYEVMSINGGERTTIESSEIESIHAIGAIVPPSRWRQQ